MTPFRPTPPSVDIGAPVHDVPVGPVHARPDPTGGGVSENDNSNQERSPQVCGSRIDPDGRVIITTPSANCHVGEVLYVIGSAIELAVDPADWVLRLLQPPEDHGNAGGESVNTEEAEMVLAAPGAPRRAERKRVRCR
jgi:hypothetical protein